MDVLSRILRPKLMVVFGFIFLAAATTWASDAYELDNTAAAAKPLVPGDAQTGRSIDPANDVDWVTFTVDGDSKVTVNADHEFVFNGDALVRILNSNEVEVASDIGVASAVVGAGTYFATVEDAGKDTIIPDYTLRLTVVSTEPDPYENDNTNGEATALQLRTPQAAHTIAPQGDQDWYTFTLQADMPITVDTVSALGALQVTILDEDLGELFSGNTRLTPDLPRGTYFVRVEAQPGTDVSAAYTMNLWRRDGPDPYEDDDTAERASWIGNSGPKQTHNFHDANDTDWVRFHAETGMGIDVVIDTIGLNANPDVALFRSDGITLIDQGSGFLSWEADATGFYLVRVTNSPTSTFGADTVYTIGVPLHPPGIVPGSLIGVVRDADTDAPIANALLQITTFGNFTARTDARGIYIFPALPTGSYTAQASAGGYEDATPASANVGSGSTTLNFVLAPDPVVQGDIDGNDVVNALDVQLVVNKALGVDIGSRDADVNDDNAVNALDIQIVVNAALGVSVG